MEQDSLTDIVKLRGEFKVFEDLCLFEIGSLLFEETENGENVVSPSVSGGNTLLLHVIENIQLVWVTISIVLQFCLHLLFFCSDESVMEVMDRWGE